MEVGTRHQCASTVPHQESVDTFVFHTHPHNVQPFFYEKHDGALKVRSVLQRSPTPPSTPYEVSHSSLPYASKRRWLHEAWLLPKLPSLLKDVVTCQGNSPSLADVPPTIDGRTGSNGCDPASGYRLTPHVPSVRGNRRGKR